MSTTYKGKLGIVPVLAFIAQFFWVGFVYAFGWALTYFPMGILVALTARKAATHPITGHPLEERHSDKYMAEGASGFWEYWASPWRWLNPWNNYEDGTLGEPSGKTSARCKGRERTKWNQFLWLCRNPFNTAKRTSDFFACFVNDCIIEYWGTYDLDDHEPIKQGWQLVKAIRVSDGKTYYGFRWVVLKANGKVFQMKAGFKLKPSHGTEQQDSDDLDKAWTFNIHFNSDPA